MFYFDKPIHRSGPAPPPFCCIPCTCCGPPVLFTHKPKCCCLDLVPCFGEQVKFAPANIYGCKQYLVCGNPCYVDASLPIVGGLKNGDEFLVKYKEAVAGWKAKSGIAENEMVIFESVSDNIADFGASKGLGADKPVGAPASPDGDSIQRAD